MKFPEECRTAYIFEFDTHLHQRRPRRLHPRHLPHTHTPRQPSSASSPGVIRYSAHCRDLVPPYSRLLWETHFVDSSAGFADARLCVARRIIRPLPPPPTPSPSPHSAYHHHPTLPCLPLLPGLSREHPSCSQTRAAVGAGWVRLLGGVGLLPAQGALSTAP